ncbi:phytanoyl-CoA dioxygenase family protein [Leptospira borgpetersenii serovar Ballum]|uniref:phytanoyl-CoA dioxygenase family protein n=1 Tax=Leptospira borgpetersenii TaxID=174 RepID=UPI001880E746|nr:phytanoyl-CoA dioxygenase family protein [Leptospira borgpetersenii]MBE8223431.1 phytanoyl-CoA dioxygenase family protein [Leptospira borgpetersenii serovar Ballum]
MHQMNTDFFEKNGYQIFENLIDLRVIEEVREKLQIDSLASIKNAQKEIGFYTDDFVSDFENFRLKNDGKISSLSKATFDAISGHISLETRLSPVLQLIPSLDSVKNVVSSILKSSNIFMHMPPTARFVLPANNNVAVPPHQDIVYNKHLSNFVTIWIPLVEIDDECGGVVVYEGSNFFHEKNVKNEKESFWLKGLDVSNFTPKHCKMKAGSLLALNKWIIHASMPNNSTRVRYSIDHRFFGELDSSSKHYLDLQNGKVVSP